MSRCSCGKQHRTYRTLAKCIWPRAAWIAGRGPFALLAHCSVLTVTLHETLESALAAKNVIDRTACGHACHRAHKIVRLDESAS